MTELGLGLDGEGGVGALPVASEENKQLRAEVIEQSQELSGLRRDTSVQKERSRALQEHLNLVRQELQHTQALLTAREKVNKRCGLRYIRPSHYFKIWTRDKTEVL